MKILTAAKDDCLVVRLTGDIDHHSACSARCQIDEEIEETKPKRVVLDLTETEFMDSSGLGLILGRLRKTKERGIRFQLLNPGEQVLRILRLAGVEKQLEIQYL